MFPRILAATFAVASIAACSSSSNAQPAAAPKQPAAHAKAEAPAVGRPDADGKVHIRATADDFVPSRIEVEGGKPVTLVFTREVEKTCMTGVVFPALKIEKDIPLHSPVEIEVTPEVGGTITFQCPMGMGKSAVVGLPKA